MSIKDNTRPEKAVSGNQSSFGMEKSGFRVAIALMALILCAVVIWPLQAEQLNQEGGPFETISAAALLAAGLAALVRFPGLKRLYIGVTCLLLAERELEADIYSEGTVPFMILSGLDDILDMTLIRVVLAVIILGGAIWHGVPNARLALKQRAPFLLIFVLAGLSAVVAQLLEEVSGLFDETLSPIMAIRLFALEETLEMFFSIGILASVLIGWPKSNIEEKPDDQQQKSDTR